MDINRLESYKQLAYAFSHWAGRRWVDSYLQNVSLRREAEKRGFRDAIIPMYLERNQRAVFARTWRYEPVTVRGKSQERYRDVRTGRFIKRP